MPVPISLLILISEYSDFKTKYHLSQSVIRKVASRVKNLKLIVHLFARMQMLVTPTKFQFGSFHNVWTCICQTTTLWALLGCILIFWGVLWQLQVQKQWKNSDFDMSFGCTYSKRWQFLHFDSLDHRWHRFLNKWQLIWKLEYSATTIRNKIGTGII